MLHLYDQRTVLIKMWASYIVLFIFLRTALANKPVENSTEPVCGYNEEYVSCKTLCPPQSCDIAYTEYACGPQTCEPGCDCIKDHLRNKSDICIPNDECPAPVSCSIPSECRPTCSNRNPQNCTYVEPPDNNVDGCQCQKGYILSEPEGICIRSEDCPLPECGYNEIPVQCRSICPPQQCGVDPALIRCMKPDCEPGCDCIEDHLRNASGLCIPSNQCPGKCSVSIECRRTCANPNPANCSYTEPPKDNQDGCQCQSGYILSDVDGKCIKIEDCPKGCNGDPHAVAKECPVPCPATCDMPEPMLTCKRECDPIGCECESGYILSDGKCIYPDDCEGGNPCGETAVFSSCKSYCPYDYCPVDDSREPIVCEYYPFSPCYPGCICKLNHKRKSVEDDRCIVSSDCPPVNCTRPNEEWSCCPSECLAEDCEDVDEDVPACNTLVLNCQPKCICKPNTYRDKSDICIDADDCRHLPAPLF